MDLTRGFILLFCILSLIASVWGLWRSNKNINKKMNGGIRIFSKDGKAKLVKYAKENVFNGKIG